MKIMAEPRSINREDVHAFYDTYYETLDKMRLAEWPDLFTEECVYRVISRENYERGFRLATIGAESRGMLRDRVTGLTQLQVYAPRYYRRFPGPILIGEAQGDELAVEHNLLMVQTRVDHPSEIIMASRCYDLLTRAEGSLRLKRRDVVFDSEMVLNSLIYPA